MSHRFCVIILITAALLTACRASSPPESEQPPQGRLLVWHPFKGTEAEVLNEIFGQYTELYPEVTIIREYVLETKMSDRFVEQIESGLGPDLFINSYIRTLDLIEAGLVKDLSSHKINTSIYLPAAVSQVRYKNKLYGLPLSLDTRVLCYNKDKVDQPPTTFEELVEEAHAGHRVAVFSTFGATFWGVSALGGQLLDEKGRVVLDQGNGLVEWLEALKEANNEPNFIFNDDEATIHNAFTAGELSYYVCWSSVIPDLQAVLGKDKIGVVPLPADAGKPAGPFVLTNSMMISNASAPDTATLALQLARFMTNVQQQTKLALETKSQIPANADVKINDQLSPVVAALVTQSKTGVAVPLEHIRQAVAAAITYGDVFFTRVLEGELDPRLAASELTRIVNSEYGFE